MFKRSDRAESVPLRLDPEICMDDGILSVYHLRSRYLGDYLQIAFNAILGRTPQAYGVTCRTVHRSVRVYSQSRLPFQNAFCWHWG
ncbi:MAG: hypothetical protein JW862_01105 [Anaerolineales bacterium]|nr:hypothetical protein [Anaerolineales bacterium]